METPAAQRKVGDTQTANRAEGVVAPDAELPQVSPIAPANGLAPSLERRRLQFYLFLILADMAVLLGSFYVVRELYPAAAYSEGTGLAGSLLLPLYLTIAMYNGSYSRDGLVIWRGAALRALTALAISAALFNFFAFFAKMNAEFSRVAFSSGLILTGLGIIAARYLFSKWVRRVCGPVPANLLLIVADGTDLDLPNFMKINAAEHDLRPDVSDPHALDRLAKYLRNMDKVLVSCATQNRADWARVLKGSGIHGEVTSGYAREIGALGIIHRDEASVSSILVSRGHLGLRARAVKRLFDVGLSLAGLIVFFPILFLSAVLIKLQDGGPVFFTQRRMGRGNRLFEIYKLRTMSVEKTDHTRDWLRRGIVCRNVAAHLVQC